MCQSTLLRGILKSGALMLGKWQMWYTPFLPPRVHDSRIKLALYGEWKSLDLPSASNKAYAKKLLKAGMEPVCLCLYKWSFYHSSNSHEGGMSYWRAPKLCFQSQLCCLCRETVSNECPGFLSLVGDKTKTVSKQNRNVSSFACWSQLTFNTERSPFCFQAAMIPGRCKVSEYYSSQSKSLFKSYGAYLLLLSSCLL